MFDRMTQKNISLVIIGAAATVAGYLYLASTGRLSPSFRPHVGEDALAAKFEELSKHGNSSCSAEFTTSVAAMPDGARLQGSCCSPMDLHRYSEQVAGLKKYSHIPEIPPDPYDVDVALAKRMQRYYDVELTGQQQAAYDYAMEHSHEKGPCCCKCWRWYVYGGLAKYLIQNYGFTGEQVTDVWNLSDGCGGAGDHAGH